MAHCIESDLLNTSALIWSTKQTFLNIGVRNVNTVPFTSREVNWLFIALLETVEMDSTLVLGIKWKREIERASLND